MDNQWVWQLTGTRESLAVVGVNGNGFRGGLVSREELYGFTRREHLKFQERRYQNQKPEDDGGLHLRELLD